MSLVLFKVHFNSSHLSSLKTMVVLQDNHYPEASLSFEFIQLSSGWGSFMSRSHQTFRLVPAVKKLGIMLRNRCQPTTFHTITTEDADRWCLNWPL